MLDDTIIKNIQANDEVIRNHINECALSLIHAGIVELQKNLRSQIPLCPPPEQENLLQWQTPICGTNCHDKYKSDCYWYFEHQEMGGAYAYVGMKYMIWVQLYRFVKRQTDFVTVVRGEI